MVKNAGEWEKSINDLVDLYRKIERRSIAVPTFSLVPFLIIMWNTVKFEVCFILDIFLLIPMNTIILLRNIFPGRWRYRSFSWKYIRYAIVWVWRGEIPFAPIAVMRSLVTFMLSSHVKSRLQLLQRYIYLDELISDEERTPLISQITRALEHWKQPGILHLIYTFGLPTLGPVIELYRYLFPGQLPRWLVGLGFMLIGYAIGFVITAFMVKRGLMMGAVGRAAYFPGALDTARYYAEERRILGGIGIRKNEFPLDILLAFLNISIGYLSIKGSFAFYEFVGLSMPPPERIAVQMVIQGVIFVVLIGISVYRRRALERR